MKYLRSLIITILVVLIAAPVMVLAVEVSRESMKFDENLYDTEKNKNFGEPESILIVPIEAPVSGFNVSSADWFKGMYYYFAGRLGLGDIQFHYAVTQDGLVLEGIKNGPEQSVSIPDGPSSPIVIAYLGENGVNDFSKTSYTKLGEFILEKANEYAIDLEKVEVKSLRFTKKDNNISFETLSAGGRYNITLSQIIEEITPNYKPIKREYSLSVSDLVLPAQNVDPLSEVVVKFKVTNKSKYNIYKGTDAEFILAKESGDLSIFYDEATWVSQNSVEVLRDGEFLQSGETKEVEVRLDVPLYFGEQKEIFVLKNLNNEVYPNTNLEIKLNINRSNDPVVEVLDTETGTLNVRNVPNGEVVVSVLPGQRFIQLDAQSGWIKIKIDESTSGWVLGRYVRGV